MDELLKLYNFTKENAYLAKQISTLDEKDFLNDNEAINAGYALVNEVITLFSRLDGIVLLASDKLTRMKGELFSLQGYLVNSYLGVNAYLIYDYMKVEYVDLLKELKEILSL